MCESKRSIVLQVNGALSAGMRNPHVNPKVNDVTALHSMIVSRALWLSSMPKPYR